MNQSPHQDLKNRNNRTLRNGSGRHATYLGKIGRKCANPDCNSLIDGGDQKFIGAINNITILRETLGFKLKIDAPRE